MKECLKEAYTACNFVITDLRVLKGIIDRYLSNNSKLEDFNIEFGDKLTSLFNNYETLIDCFTEFYEVAEKNER